MKHLKFLLSIVLLSFSFSANAEDDKTKIPPEDKWGQNADGDRSLSSSPSLR